MKRLFVCVSACEPLIRDVVEKITIFPDSYQRRRQGIIEVVLRMPGPDRPYGGTYSRFLSYGEGLAGELACLADVYAEDFAESIKDIHWHLQRLRDAADAKAPPQMMMNCRPTLLACWSASSKNSEQRTARTGTAFGPIVRS